MRLLPAALVALLTLGSAGPSVAADFYVSSTTGKKKNPGTREAPFKELFEALDTAKDGDRIHVAEGSYVGRLKSGRYTIAQANIELFGGYSADFQRRDPFRTQSILHDELPFDGNERGGILGLPKNTGDRASHWVVDGFVFDQGDKITYVERDRRASSRKDLSAALSVTTDFEGATVDFRNNIILNGSSAGIHVIAGANSKIRIVNNIILNSIAQGVFIQASAPRNERDRGAEVEILHNTIAYTWQQQPPTSVDAYLSRGNHIEIGRHGSYRIEDNILAHGLEAGVFNDLNRRVRINHNVFFNNHLSDYTFFLNAHVKHARVDELDEVPPDQLIEMKDNLAIDPQLEGLNGEYRKSRSQFVFSYAADVFARYEDVGEDEQRLFAGARKLSAETKETSMQIKNRDGKVVDSIPVTSAANLSGAYWGVRYPLADYVPVPTHPKAKGIGASPAPVK